VNPEIIVYSVCGLAVLAALFMLRKQVMEGVFHGIGTTIRVAGMTFAETRRRRILQVVIFLAALMLVAMLTITRWSPAEAQKAIVSGGLDLMLLMGMLVAIFICAFLIPTDIERRTIYSVLSKPVRRWEFVVGKYLGAMAVVALLFGVMLLVQTLVLLFFENWYFDKQVIVAGIIEYFGICVFAAAVMAISTVASSLSTVIAGFLIWVVGSLQSMSHNILTHTEGASKYIMTGMSAILPHLEKYSLQSDVTEQLPLNYAIIGQSAVHGLVYVIVCLILASILFNERQV
jgi:ABC-type transport system involved in multi-copper enzyme maturation permease subunit